MNKGEGSFGPWTVTGPNLTYDEVRALTEGTVVEVVWSGGNGPHRYVVVFDDRGEPYLAMPDDDPNGRMRYYNPVGDFVGDHPLTQIRQVEA